MEWNVAGAIHLFLGYRYAFVSARALGHADVVLTGFESMRDATLNTETELFAG